MKWDRRAQFQVSNVGIHFVFFSMPPLVLSLLRRLGFAVCCCSGPKHCTTRLVFNTLDVQSTTSNVYSFFVRLVGYSKASGQFTVLVLHVWKTLGQLFSVHVNRKVSSNLPAIQHLTRTSRAKVPHSLTACAVATVFPLSLLQSRVFSKEANVFNLHRRHIFLLSIDGSLLSFHFLLLLLNHLLLSIDDSLLSFDCFLLVLNQQQKFIAWSDRPINAERHVGFKYKMQELDTVNCFRIHQFKNKHWTWGRGPIPSLGPLTLPSDMFPCHRCRVMGPGTVSLEKRFGWHIWNIRNIWNIWNLWNIWSIWNIRNIWNIQNIWNNSNIWKIWNIWNIVNIWNIRYIQNIRDIVCNILRQQKVDHRRVCYHIYIYIYEIYEWIKYNIMIHAHILSATSTAFFLGVSLKKTSSRHTWGVLPILVKIIGCCHPPSPRLPFASSNSLTDLLEITFLQSFFQPWREKQ